MEPREHLTATCLVGRLHPIRHDHGQTAHSRRALLAVTAVLPLRWGNHHSSNGQNRQRTILHDVGALLMFSLKKEVASEQTDFREHKGFSHSFYLPVDQEMTYKLVSLSFPLFKLCEAFA
jgi:hypothetical protein